MYTDETILTFGKHKFTRLCRVSADYLLQVYQHGKNSPHKELYEYVVANIDSIRARARGEIIAPELVKICDKIVFVSEKDAKDRIRKLSELKQDNKKPVRAYECEKCGGWHLTSIPYEKWEKKD